MNFFVCLNGSRDDLDLQLYPVSPTRGGTQTVSLIFIMYIVVIG